MSQSVQLAQWGTLILILFGCLLAFFPKELLCFSSEIAKGLSLILMLTALIVPPKKIGWILALFFVWPKPYLWETVKSFQGNLSFLTVWVIGLIMWLWLACCVRIKGQKIWEQLIHQSLKKTPFATNFIFLMPSNIISTMFFCE